MLGNLAEMLLLMFGCAGDAGDRDDLYAKRVWNGWKAENSQRTRRSTACVIVGDQVALATKGSSVPWASKPGSLSVRLVLLVNILFNVGCLLFRICVC